MLNISGCVKRANNAQCSRWQYDVLFFNDTNFLCLLRFTFLFDEFQRDELEVPTNWFVTLLILSVAQCVQCLCPFSFSHTFDSFLSWLDIITFVHFGLASFLFSIHFLFLFPFYSFRTFFCSCNFLSFFPYLSTGIDISMVFLVWIMRVTF